MLPERAALTLAGRPVSTGTPPLVIAEIGLNHGGDPDRALALVHAAAEAGADAIKLQTLSAAALVSGTCPAPAHVSAASLVDFFAAFELDEAAHLAVARLARDLGLGLLSTPLSLAGVDLLERVGVDAYKIASGDLTWDALVARCAATGRPLILSTGMAAIDEVAAAVATARAHGARDLALLHCVSAYPVPAGHENLAAIRTLADRFALPVGLSDHGADTTAWPVAVGLGATIFERHLVLPHDETAVDLDVSSTPGELAAAIAVARRAWHSLGRGVKVCLDVEASNRVPSRRSLHAARDLEAGVRLTDADLVALRPATGLPPGCLPALVGRRLRRPIRAGEALAADHLETAGGLEQSHVA